MIKSKISNLGLAPEQLLWACREETVLFYLDSNTYKNVSYSDTEWMLGIGSYKQLRLDTNKKDALHDLKRFHQAYSDWMLGYLSYELKNELEDPEALGNLSAKTSEIDFPVLSFHIPEVLFICKNNKVETFVADESFYYKLDDLLATARKLEVPEFAHPSQLDIQSLITKEDYLHAVRKLLEHIQYGDIFEVNYCQEFYAEQASIDPVLTYLHLKKVSPTPFSSFVKEKDRFILSASPERYLKKIGKKLISQPIKGTIRRGKSEEEDLALIQQLQNDPKERGENLMIVDLVRNDLSITAQDKSVRVEELCGIYTYPQVHQMISTVGAELDNSFHFTDAIRHSFPMGSMTGAPKLKAMELIEKYEQSKRGMFSGSVGYITPDGDFDFSVIIRSILYHNKKKHLSFTTGSAITRLSSPEKEYEECLLKAEAMIKTLKG